MNFAGISGAVKLSFRTILSPGQGIRTGFATITNGEHKLPISVLRWTQQNLEIAAAMEERNWITVVGKVTTDTHGMVKLVCSTFNNVKLEEAPKMPIDAWARGSRVLRVNPN